MQIYENIVKKVGNLTKELGEDSIILFGEGAPDTLVDFTYIVNVNPLKEDIQVGDIIIIDETEYKIIAIGDIACKNLVGLGHVTINFTGDIDSLLPGSIVVEKTIAPEIKIGTKIKIVRR